MHSLQAGDQSNSVIWIQRLRQQAAAFEDCTMHVVWDRRGVAQSHLLGQAWRFFFFISFFAFLFSLEISKGLDISWKCEMY